jgi:hypothetical protein
MKTDEKTARRYHWHSDSLESFVEEPHTGISGTNQGIILNLTDTHARNARDEILKLTREHPQELLQEFIHLKMPSHHDVRKEDVNLKRLGAVLWLANENRPADFEELLLLNGVGPRTIQSLALVSEVIHGSPARFRDPARFSFAHGGKDGHPFPVPTSVYDEVIDNLHQAVSKAKIGANEKNEAIKKLHHVARDVEKEFVPNDNLSALIEKERNESWQYGGKTVFGDAKKSSKRSQDVQLKLF